MNIILKLIFYIWESNNKEYHVFNLNKCLILETMKLWYEELKIKIKLLKMSYFVI